MAVQPVRADSEPEAVPCSSKPRGIKPWLQAVAVIALMMAAVFLSALVPVPAAPAEEAPALHLSEGWLTGELVDREVDGVLTDSCAVVTYTGSVDAVWQWRDACAPVYEGSDGSYSERGWTTVGLGTVVFDSPGLYDLRLVSGGEVLKEGQLVVDGDVLRSWEWFRMSSNGAISHYSVDWVFQFSDFLEYRLDDCVRESSAKLRDSRFAVVDGDILDLESTLRQEYASVHGSEPVAGDPDYADYLLSFVQCAIAYPPSVRPADSSRATGDAYLYGAAEYWAYPMETLYMGMGDCEDASFLLAALYSAAGYRSGLCTPPGHMMVLVAVDGYARSAIYETLNPDSVSLCFTAIDGTVYRFCETTCEHAVPLGYCGADQQQGICAVRSVTLVEPHSAA